MTTRQPLSNANGRIAIVDGLRTPFARIATHFRYHSAIDLGALALEVDSWGMTWLAVGVEFAGHGDPVEDRHRPAHEGAASEGPGRTVVTAVTTCLCRSLTRELHACNFSR